MRRATARMAPGLLLVAFTCLACASTQSGSLGSLDEDVKTAPGSYEGYSVARCSEGHYKGSFVLTGEGAKDSPLAADASEDGPALVRAEIQQATEGLAVGWATGAGCSPGRRAVQVYAAHARDIDELISRIGRVLREKSSRGEVVIHVSGVITVL